MPEPTCDWPTCTHPATERVSTGRSKVGGHWVQTWEQLCRRHAIEAETEREWASGGGEW